MAWELLTTIYGIPAERLYVTYFGGEERYNLDADLEAKTLWMQVGVPEERILPFGMKENFWEMGESGPCGPCSEIHFDRIGGRDASLLVNKDDPDVLELWNLVFMQFNRENDGSLRTLPNKHVDTGMGFERVLSVLQNKSSNYDTDVFMPIFSEIQASTGCRPYTGKVGKACDLDGVDMAYRVVADHIRTLTFAISDGGLPSNDGRGYVLRRILRRAIRYSHEKLKAKPGFFSGLVDVVVCNFGDAFPELRKCPEHVKEILLEEELQFRKTLERGLVQFSRFAKVALDSNGGTISGLDAWRLYDTYGFPADLTRLMAEEAGLVIDDAGFVEAQNQSKELSRAGRGNEIDDALSRVTIDVHLMSDLEKKFNVPFTQDCFKYTDAVVDATVVALIIDGQIVQQTKDSKQHYFGVLLDRTNFYAESGGQLYDIGHFTIDGQMEFVIETVQAYGGYVLHVGYLKYGNISTGDKLVAAYDETRRNFLKQNHTATHILNFAIGKVLVDQSPDQKGSLVAPDRLRFDFNSIKPLSLEQISGIENKTNNFVRKASIVSTETLPLSEAMSLPGLRAVFGETYPDPVRVVSLGANLKEILADPLNPNWKEVSIELCGGTHVQNCKEIQSLLILSESAIAKGIRRVVAVTGEEAAKALKYESELNDSLGKICNDKSSGEGFEESVKAFTKALEEANVSLLAKSRLRDQLASLRQKIADADKAMRQEQSKLAVESVSLCMSRDESPMIVQKINVGSNGKALLDALNLLKKENRSGILYSVDPVTCKIYYFSLVAEAHSNLLSAADWAKSFGDPINGRSGGKASTAQGSAPLAETESTISAAENLALQFAKLKLGEI